MFQKHASDIIVFIIDVFQKRPQLNCRWIWFSACKDCGRCQGRGDTALRTNGRRHCQVLQAAQLSTRPIANEKGINVAVVLPLTIKEENNGARKGDNMDELID